MNNDEDRKEDEVEADPRYVVDCGAHGGVDSATVYEAVQSFLASGLASLGAPDFQALGDGRAAFVVSYRSP